MEQKILLIGNGFDLFHSLPTSYSNFLNICIKVNSNGIDNNLRRFKETLSNDKYSEFSNLIHENIWVHHFSTRQKQIDNKWTDFENEIKEVTYDVYKHMSNDGGKDIDIYHNLFSTFPPIRYLNKSYTYRMLFSRLSDDHKRLTQALNIYMDSFVNKLSIEKKNLFIDKTFDKVLSFNYTSTYTKIYNPNVSCCYIHGKASNTSHTNLVLGFDDSYLGQNNSYKELLPYGKQYQRINNQNDNRYWDWLNEINSKGIPTKLDVFGHSLSQPDGDILREFISNPYVHTDIICKDDSDRSDKIMNLELILGANKLSLLIAGNNPQICFEIASNSKT